MLDQGLGHHFYHLGTAQHAGLDGVGADVGKTGDDLLAHDSGRHNMGVRHAQRVLHGDGGDGRLGIDAKGLRRLDVGLNPGAAG